MIKRIQDFINNKSVEFFLQEINILKPKWQKDPFNEEIADNLSIMYCGAMWEQMHLNHGRDSFEMFSFAIDMAIFLKEHIEAYTNGMEEDIRALCGACGDLIRHRAKDLPVNSPSDVRDYINWLNKYIKLQKVHDYCFMNDYSNYNQFIACYISLGKRLIRDNQEESLRFFKEAEGLLEWKSSFFRNTTNYFNISEDISSKGFLDIDPSLRDFIFHVYDKAEIFQLRAEINKSSNRVEEALKYSLQSLDLLEALRYYPKASITWDIFIKSYKIIDYVATEKHVVEVSKLCNQKIEEFKTLSEGRLIILPEYNRAFIESKLI